MKPPAACLALAFGLLAACGRTGSPSATATAPAPTLPIATATPSLPHLSPTLTDTPQIVVQGLLRLTNDPARDSYPAWSRDGQRIAFASTRTGVHEIYSMNAEGGDLTQLTEDDGSYLKDDPSWSADGSQIAFASRSDLSRIYAFDVRSAEINPFNPMVSTPQGYPQPLSDPYADAFSPSWSPDGRRLAMTMFDSNMVLQVFTLDLRSGGLVQLSGSPADTSGPSWSADGRWIAYTAEDGGNAEIYVVAADGSGLRQLTDDPARDNSPSWSPDGRFIVFHSTRGGDSDLYALPVDGGDVIRLETGGPQNSSPAWSPDGRYIAFVSDRDGNAEIYLIDAPALGP